MLLMIPHGYETAAPGTIPDDIDAVAAMMAYRSSRSGRSRRLLTFRLRCRP
jgi:hypothetical protein